MRQPLPDLHHETLRLGHERLREIAVLLTQPLLQAPVPRHEVEEGVGPDDDAVRAHHEAVDGVDQSVEARRAWE